MIEKNMTILYTKVIYNITPSANVDVVDKEVKDG